MNDFVKVAKTSEIPIGKMKAVKFGEKNVSVFDKELGKIKTEKIAEYEIVIANVGGKFYAMGNRCTHKGGDLSKGSLSGKVVTCPRHGFKFDVTSGKVAYAPFEVKLMKLIKPEPTYEIKVEEKNIMLRKDQIGLKDSKTG